jgi:2-iminobutanoate/2-iminopropanoate deaminase
MPTPESFDAGVAHQIGRYADAVRVPAGHDQIFVSGTPGLAPDGTLPDTMTGEATHAWQNIAAYVAVRKEFIHHEPVYMLAVVPGLVRPEFRVEIEVIAAVPAAEA